MTAAIVRGTFSDWRPVKTRGVLQLVIEVPVEQAQRVMDTLGFPMPGEEKAVAVALLVDNDNDKDARLAERGWPAEKRHGDDIQPSTIEAPIGDRDPDTGELLPGGRGKALDALDEPTGAKGLDAVQGAGAAVDDKPTPVGQLTAPAAPKRRTPFRELRPSAQAGIMCNDPKFQAWIGAPQNPGENIVERAAQHVRQLIYVRSRSELDTNSEKAARWAALLTEFERDTGQIAERRG